MNVIPILIDKEINKNDNIAEMIVNSKKIENGDVLVIAQKIISKCEGQIIYLDSVDPSILAEGISSQYQKDPRIVELILRESNKIIRMSKGVIIVETKHGFICANAGIDESNVPDGYATLLPKNPDESAKKIMSQIKQSTGKKIPVIISDTFGRPFRLGQTNHAIGIAGISPILNYEGTRDSHGRILRVTAIAVADELCSAAELVMQKTRSCPAALIRDYWYDTSEDSISSLIRKKDEDLFR